MEKVNKLGLGMVPIGAVDITGRQLHQYEAVVLNGTNSIILWSKLYRDFTGMTSDGLYLLRENMDEAEYVLFTEEEQWDEIEDVIRRLHETEAEAVTRLMTSHFNMEAMMNETAAALDKIAEETTDEVTKEFASSKVAFLRGLIPKSDGQV